MSSGLEPGEVVGGYRIERLLGRGGMAAVYLAEDTQLKRRVALKVLSPELASDAVFRQRFIDESERLASVDHPNIIPVYAAGQDGDHLFIAMRLVDTTDLKQLIEHEGPLPPERAVALVTQVAGALDAAHAKGLVHRDVKPANVLVALGSGGDHAYLSDFGLTKRTEETSGLTKTGYFMGTIDYVAPEQISGKGVDGRTDQYALACVLYQCLTGHAPYPRDDDAAVLFSHLSEPPPKVTETRPELPPKIDDVIAKGMAKEKDDRYADCMGLASAARAALLGDIMPSGGREAPLDETKLAEPPRQATDQKLTVPPPPGPTPAPIPDDHRRRRTPLVIGAVVVAVAIVAAGLALLSGGASDGGGADGGGGSGTDEGSGAGGPVSLVALDATDGTASPPLRGNFSPRSESISIEHGELWQVTEDSLIVRDPSTGEILEKPRIDHEWAVFDAGYGSAWIAHPPSKGHSDLERLDPKTGNPQHQPFDGTPIDVGVGTQKVWLLTDDGTLTEFDREGNVVDSFPTGVEDPTSAIPMGSYVWLAESDAVAKFDPAERAVVDRISLPADGSLIGVDTDQGEGEQAWIFDPSAETLAPIDAKTGEVRDALAVGVGRITDAAIMNGLLWVSSDDLVTEVALDSTGRPKTFDVPEGVSAGGIAPSPDGSLVWIANYNRAMG
jgi:serine/threonine protein kinase